jgi:hypothetical protein
MGALSRAPARCHIGTLRLSIPGVNRSFGRSVAARVAAKLAEGIPANLVGQYETLELKVHPSGPGEEALSDAIVRSVLVALGRTRRR